MPSFSIIGISSASQTASSLCTHESSGLDFRAWLAHAQDSTVQKERDASSSQRYTCIRNREIRVWASYLWLSLSSSAAGGFPPLLSPFASRWLSEAPPAPATSLFIDELSSCGNSSQHFVSICTEDVIYFLSVSMR